MRLGVAAVAWLERAGLLGAWHVAQWLLPVAGTIACIVVDALANTWTVATAIVLGVLVGVAGYVTACERLASASQFRVLNEAMVGHLAVLLRGYCSYDESDATQRAVFEERVRQLQQHLLNHIVHVVADATGRPIEVFSSNWCVRSDGGKTFSARAYSKNMHDRQPGLRHHLIQSDRPGASKAFVDGLICLVEDRRDASMSKYFHGNEWYVSILSIPVVIAPAGSPEVVGVLNIDCNRPGVLSKDLWETCGYLAYLIGLCEAIANEGWRG
jgi:hypothetical protein